VNGKLQAIRPAILALVLLSIGNRLSVGVRAANPEAVVIVGPANTVGPILQKAHAQAGNRCS
jgi:hypothetical protein